MESVIGKRMSDDRVTEIPSAAAVDSRYNYEQ